MFRVSAVLLFMASGFALHAQTVIATDLTAPIIYENYVVQDAPVGQSFSTGSSGYNLTSVTLTLSNDSYELEDARRGTAARRFMGHAKASTRKSPGKTITVSGCASACTQVMLWSDTGGPGPGTLLATSTTTELDTALPSSPQAVTFAFSNYPLSANTRYWILVAASNTSVVQWYGTDNPSGTGLASEYYLYDSVIVSDLDDDSAFLMSVTGTAATPAPPVSTTPIPSSLMLALVGLLCAGMYLTWHKFAWHKLAWHKLAWRKFGVDAGAGDVGRGGPGPGGH
jgi:hypothetical protein